MSAHLSPRGRHDVSLSAAGDTSPPPGGHTSGEALRDTSCRPRGDVSLAGGRRVCARPGCGELLNATARKDAIYCGQPCRQAAHRFGRFIQVATSCATPKRLAYADPPYPGLSRRYYRDHPDYRGEVDHVALVSRLQEYDGWALSTSERALPYVLSLLAGVDGWRIASWVRGSRPNRSRGPLSSWEPVIYRCARNEVSSSDVDDSFVYAARARLSDPRRVVGAKPAAFCGWLFGLLGSRLGDSLDDIFPGSGGVRAAWDLHQGLGR